MLTDWLADKAGGKGPAEEVGEIDREMVKQSFLFTKKHWEIFLTSSLPPSPPPHASPSVNEFTQEP